MASKTTWTTYRTTGYTYSVSQDQASAGGVHHHQIRRVNGGWQYRICQANGLHKSYGDVITLPEAEGEARWATAMQEA